MEIDLRRPTAELLLVIVKAVIEDMALNVRRGV